jgi:D-serine deaminase-like pyridoxal phosphate-dependent protein
MTTRPPAEIGMRLEDVDTPALLVELDAFERNLRRMADRVAGTRLKLRPHAKTHKCAVIALKQIALGAVGVCCQKVGEAEAMVLGGVPDVYVSNQIVGASKLRRLAGLARQARIATCVDDPVHIAALETAAREMDVSLTVLVEVNMGGDRCGVEPGEPALRLAEAVGKSERLRFAGLQAYHGSAQHLRTPAERKAAIDQASERAGRTRALLEANGIACPIVTGAGTGTFPLEIASGVYDELQPGSYVFMDADYGRNRDDERSATGQFEHSLFVWSTVMSRPTDNRAVVDAGLKAVSVDSGMPTLVGYDEAEYVRASDEHGKLDLKRPTNRLRIGDKVKLVPGHCDPTVNLYDWYVGVRDGRVEALWPIAARGALT